MGSPTHYERLLALIAELRIEYADGSIETIITDESWRYRRSFTTLSDIYNGETQDYSQPLGAWKQALPSMPPVSCASGIPRSCTIWKHSR